MTGKYTVKTFANDSGLWRAEILFNCGKSPTDYRSQFNLRSAIDYSRKLARKAIVEEISVREQKTWESWDEVTKRVRESLPQLSVIKQNISPSTNVWYGITLGE